MSVTVSTTRRDTTRWNKKHHEPTRFINPWPSFREHGMVEGMSWLAKGRTLAVNETQESIDSHLPVRSPTWGAGSNPAAIKATWLGHASYLVEMPHDPATARDGRGVRILFDPVFSHRCSPFSFMGPARFTKAPCDIEDIPEVDAIVISHNHYDHMDTHTITTLFRKNKNAPPPHIFAPLGNESYFASLGCIPAGHAHTLDWWESKRIETPNHGVVDLHCTPAQHFTGRSLTDRFKSLWASWAVVGISPGGIAGQKVWFGGDTGYRSVRDGEDEDEVPYCPAFEEIGEAFGGFDLAMIPIGAYLPRDFMSPIHCAPQDSVRVFKDIKAKRAVGMHWGAWMLTSEHVFEPPQKLQEELDKACIARESFTCQEIGTTITVEP